MQERITSTKSGAVTSVQAVYVPADDLTDPAPATTFAHLDATTVLSRQIASLGIYPAIDILGSSTRRDDELIHPQMLQRIRVLRRHLSDMNPIEAMEFLKDRLSRTDSNEEFLITMNG